MKQIKIVLKTFLLLITFFFMFSCKNQEEKLQEYIQSNNINKLENIIKDGEVNINKTLPNGEFPLIYSIKNDNYLMTKNLIELGASINNYGDTIPLFNAVENNNLQIINLLIDSKADISILNSKNQNLLFYAKNKKIAELFVEKLNINQQDTLGNTPLINSVYKNNPELIDLYLNTRGIDIYKKNNLGKSIFDLAKEKKNDKLIKKLNEKRRFDNWPQKGDVIYIVSMIGNDRDRRFGVYEFTATRRKGKNVYGDRGFKGIINHTAFRSRKSAINYWQRQGYNCRSGCI